MKHTITVELDLSEEALRSEVIDQAVRALIGISNNPPSYGSRDEDWDEDAEIEVSPVSASARNVTYHFMQRIQRIQDEEIRTHVRAAIQPAIAEALAGEIQPTDEWGKARGQKVSLASYIVSAVQRELTNTDRNSYGREESVLHKLVNDTVRYQLSSELSKDMEKAKAKVRAAIQAKASEVLQKTITDLVGARV